MNKWFFSVLASVMVVGSANAANVAGKISLKGTAPAAKKIKMSADPKCMSMNKGDVFEEGIVANKNGTLKNVFVYIKKGLEGKTFPAPTTPVSIDQKGCHYTPHVLGVMVGQPIEVVNSDPTLHNVHAMPEKGGQFNLGMPMQGMKMTRKFDKAEVAVKVKCDVHPWMRAYVGVVENPFYAVSDDQGNFELKNVPAGNYVVGAWHEKLGAQEVNVTVTEGKNASADFTFNAQDAK